MPPLLQWLPRFALPSALPIPTAYIVLRWSQRTVLRRKIAAGIEVPELSKGGKMAASGIIATALVLLVSSGFGIQLGLPTFLAGLGTAILVLVGFKRDIANIVKNISRGVLPLVAGLLVLVEALRKTGVTLELSILFQSLVRYSANGAAWASGVLLAMGSNLLNNLPAGLVAGRVVEMAHVPDHVRTAVLIGVDLGPNLSVTGSPATILWLTALRSCRRPSFSPLQALSRSTEPFPETVNAEFQLGLALSAYIACRSLVDLGAPMNGAVRGVLENPWLAPGVPDPHRPTSPSEANARGNGLTVPARRR